MRLTHPDYIRLVKGIYYEKRAKGEISLLLARPTPAKIRKACLHRYKQPYVQKDRKVLADFFGPAARDEDLIDLIEGMDTSRFKPLTNYLEGRTDKTDDLNLELLAWLIDFPYRPFVTGMQVQLTNWELEVIGQEPVEESVETNEITSVDRIGEEETHLKAHGSFVKSESGMPSEKEEDKETKEAEIRRFKLSRINKAMTILLALLLGFGFWYIWQRSNGNQQANYGATFSGCMYWSEDHYVEAPCNETHAGRLLLPLNKQKMKSFRRITREDTITARSIGKVHYIKRNGSIEYYTEAGYHPVEVTRKLHPLTYYMYKTHLAND